MTASLAGRILLAWLALCVAVTALVAVARRPTEGRMAVFCGAGLVAIATVAWLFS